MTSDLPTLTWSDDISRLQIRPSPIEVALWLDSLVTKGAFVDPNCTALARADRYLRWWPPSVQA